MQYGFTEFWSDREEKCAGFVGNKHALEMHADSPHCVQELAGWQEGPRSTGDPGSSR